MNNAINTTAAVSTTTTTTNYMPNVGHPLLGMAIKVECGNPSDGETYSPSETGVVIAAYGQQHTKSPTFLVMLPSRGEQGTFCLAHHNEGGSAPFYTTNARRMGEGWGKVKDMAGAIRSFGLDE